MAQRRFPIEKHDWHYGDPSEKAEIYAEAEVDDSGQITQLVKLVIIAGAQVDCDGSEDSPRIDPTGRSDTALSKQSNPAWQGKGKFVDSREVPFFVLPLNWAEVLKSNLNVYQEVKFGDIARITYGPDHVYAIFADRGGKNRKRIGEASLKVVQDLDKTKNCTTGIASGVTYEIVLDSEKLEATTDYQSIQDRGAQVFALLR